ncbi:glycosyltransferase [Chlamydiota bacterium]
MEKVSVIIPVYNKAKYISFALQSVLNQTVKDIEIIVIDDGSTDNLKEVIKPYLSRITFYEQKNQGASTARNKGIEFAKGDFICLLDADDIWLPNKIEKQLDVFRLYPDCGLVYSNGIVIDENGEETGSIIHNSRFRGYNGLIFRKLLMKNVIPTLSVVIKKKFIVNSLLFDSKYKASQDYDFWLRLAKKCEFYYINEVLFKYRITKDGITAKYNEIMYQDHITILKNIDNEIKLNVIDKIFKQIGLSLHYYAWGKDLFIQNQFSKARIKYISSFLCFPLYVYPIAYILFSFIPIKIINIIRRLKRL